MAMDATENILDELKVPITIPLRTPQFRLGETTMRRTYADKLILATGIIVILMSFVFALCRVSGAGIGR